ncbi:MAG: hypothetical protein LC798_10995 [Chloroflexi bacterium]|nr:hypothetical protein [Chloroflexota bacterium]
MKIPHDSQGYSVNPATSTVHTRYAGEHAGQTRRARTLAGAESLLDGADPHVCKTCYPAGVSRPSPVSDQPEPGQTRRTPKADDDTADTSST